MNIVIFKGISTDSIITICFMDFEKAYRELLGKIEKTEQYQIHELVPSKYDISTCNRCFLPENHPIHSPLPDGYVHNYSDL